MYPVAHIVVASGAAWSAERVAWRLFRGGGDGATIEQAGANRPSLFDYRFVALGALLPDIIDKPLAWFILGDRVEDNHLFAHTLLFALVLGLPGLYFAWRGQPWLVSLACGVIVHLLGDPVLREPQTILWPLYGWTFHSTYGLGNGLAVNLTLDFIAGSAAAAVLWRLWLHKRLCAFVIEGRI